MNSYQITGLIMIAIAVAGPILTYRFAYTEKKGVGLVVIAVNAAFFLGIIGLMVMVRRGANGHIYDKHGGASCKSETSALYEKRD